MDDVEILKIPPFLDIKGVHLYFGFKRKKTLSLLRDKKIRGYKDGKAWTILSKSILKYIKAYCNIRGEHNAEQP